MFFFSVEAKPKPRTKKAMEFGGAHVNCWIDFKLQDGAEQLARFYIRKDGWLPVSVDDVRWVIKADYVARPEWLDYYLEARKSGAFFVYHTWPLGAEE
jgi:hypothetical protein